METDANGSETRAVLHLKDTQNNNVGDAVTAGSDGAYTITAKADVYNIEVGHTGYDTYIIENVEISTSGESGKDATLVKTVGHNLSVLVLKICFNALLQDITTL